MVIINLARQDGREQQASCFLKCILCIVYANLFKAIDEYTLSLMQEADNILGMFRTRCSLFKKAYGHKTVVAFEHM